MTEIKLEKQDVLELYKVSNAESRQFLESKLGKSLFVSDIKERVKTYEDALNELGLTGIDVPSVPGSGKDVKSIRAYIKLIFIIRALNEGWEPDWEDSNQYKYYPWLEYKAGFGFSDSGYDRSLTGTDLGSRLCFKSRELALYAGKQFEALYNEFFIL